MLPQITSVPVRFIECNSELLEISHFLAYKSSFIQLNTYIHSLLLHYNYKRARKIGEIVEKRVEKGRKRYKGMDLR